MPKGGKRPGAGRKASKPGTARENFSTRITPELRTFLTRAAKRSGRSLSHEIERRLTESKSLEDWLKKNRGPRHIVGLAELVTHLARSVESLTGETWRNDAFTFSAMQMAIQRALRGLENNYGAIVTPREIRDEDAFWSGEPRTAENIGTLAAEGLWAMVRTIDRPSIRDSDFSHHVFSIAKLRDLLGIKHERPRDGRKIS